MLRAYSWSLCRRVALAGAGTGLCLSSLAQQRAQAVPAPPPAKPKSVHDLSISMSAEIEEQFMVWLPDYLKKLLELPGLNGAKIMRPKQPAAAAADKPVVVFVLGGPGAGKGTQCAKIVEEYGYAHLSAGDLLRAERKSGSDKGQMIDEYIREGKIVPVEVTIRLLMDAIAADGGKRYLIDGFPRNADNLAGWHRVVGDSLQTAGVLLYDCPEDVMEARLLERGKSSGRSDDNIESIRKRFTTFIKESMPVLQYFEQLALVNKIDGTRPVDEVWPDSQAVIAGYERKFAPAPPVATVRVAVFASDEPHTPDVAARVAADAAKRWGDGVVTVEGAELGVASSLKAFDLEALRAFD